MFKFFVPGPLPGLNEIIDAAKTELKFLRRPKVRVYEITKMKKEYTARVSIRAMLAWQDQGNRGVPKPVTRPAVILLEWIERDNRRDPDNVFCGMKFVLDGLVKARILPTDGRKWVLGVHNTIGTNDPDGPGVWVTVS